MELFRPHGKVASGLFMCLALCVWANVWAAEWPQFRGQTGQGVATATGVPVSWDAATNVRWKAPIAGSGWSSPIISRGRIYLTYAVTRASSEVSLRALCVDARNGQSVWDVEVLTADQEKANQVHEKNSLASPTPLVDYDRLYVHFGHMGTVAL